MRPSVTRAASRMAAFWCLSTATALSGRRGPRTFWSGRAPKMWPRPAKLVPTLRPTSLYPAPCNLHSVSAALLAQGLFILGPDCGEARPVDERIGKFQHAPAHAHGTGSFSACRDRRYSRVRFFVMRPSGVSPQNGSKTFNRSRWYGLGTLSARKRAASSANVISGVG